MKSRGRDIDQLLPIAMGRTAAGLLAGGSVPDVLQQVGESLEMKKTNPLTPELILTALEIRIKDRVEALRSLASRRSSVSLANLAQLLEGYTEAGGCLDPHSDLSQPGLLLFYPRMVARWCSVVKTCRLFHN